MEIIIPIVILVILALLEKDPKKNISEPVNSFSHKPVSDQLKKSIESPPDAKVVKAKIWTYSFKENKSGLSDIEWKVFREKVLMRDEYRCVKCGNDVNLTVHHISPIKAGGSNKLINLVTLCSECHESKHNRIIFSPEEQFIYKDRSHEHLSDKVIIINDAIKNRTTIEIGYTDIHGIKTNRRILPDKIIEDHGIWYVSSFCYLRNDKRTFRYSRISLL